MEEYMKLAANYGFPMVVAGYLLVRLEPLIKELQKSITLLTLVVARQSTWTWTKCGRRRWRALKLHCIPCRTIRPVR